MNLRRGASRELPSDKVAAEEEHEERRLVHSGGVESFSAGCGSAGKNAVIGFGYDRPAGVYRDKRSDSPGKLSRLGLSLGGLRDDLQHGRKSSVHQRLRATVGLSHVYGLRTLAGA